MKIRNMFALMVVSAILSGCAALAAPCRVTGSVMKVIPVIGEPIGSALDACGDAID